MTDDDAPLDDATRAALAALPADEPPAGFADRVLAARAGLAAAPPVPSPRRRRGIAAVAVAMVAAAAITLLVWPRHPASQAGHGARVAEARESIAIAGRGIAVAEAGATLAWNVADDGAARVEQGGGDVFYRVDPGASFEVITPAGDVRVTGTCFRVEVQPMKPSRAAIAGAAAGAALAAALVVTVYEGHVVVAGPSGETKSIAAGERVALGEPSPRDLVALAPPPSDVTREELLARDAAQRATVQQLTTRVASLEGKLAARPAGDGAAALPPLSSYGGNPDGSAFYDPSPEMLAEMAKNCAIQYDVPPIEDGTPTVISGTDITRLGLEPEEVEPMNAALRELHERWISQLRALYIEATGDADSADELSPTSLAQEIQDKAAKGELERVRMHMARERAGLEVAPADLSGTSPAERYLRVVVTLGDEFEKMVAESLGADRAHALREVNDGWDHHSSHSGCGDD